MNIPQPILNAILSNTSENFKSFYLYDKNQIRRHCKMFQEIPYANKSIHFATMANIHPLFLKTILEEKVNVFVNSMIHLKKVLDAGFVGSKIVFTASALDEETLINIKNRKVQVNLDSIGQLKLWNKLFGNSKVGIRCNIGDDVTPRMTSGGFFIGNQSRLGFSLKELNAIKGNPQICGLHVYVGTDILDVNYFLDCYRKLCDQVDNFPNLEYLNFGGGFGVQENGEEAFDLKEYGKRVTDLMNQVSLKYGKSLKLILEPGRIIGGNAGYFICRVTDVKDRENQCFVGVNASSVQFPRPLMYPDTANHPVSILRNDNLLKSNELKRTSIHGCSTYSRDFLVVNKEIQALQVNDIVIIGNAGSYCASSFTEFLGFPKPDEYFI